jgi:hypothetical protein
MSAADPQERLFLLIDPKSREVMGTCAGPAADGACPNAYAGHIPCERTKVLPMRGTVADGIPFSVVGDDWAGCPLAWVSEPVEPPG